MTPRETRVASHKNFDQLVIAGFRKDGEIGPIGRAYIAKISRSAEVPEDLVEDLAFRQWQKRGGQVATGPRSGDRSSKSRPRTKRKVEKGGRNFAAIDFETATSSRESACAVGLCLVDGGAVVQREKRLIQPPGNQYAPFNISIHGITPSDTADASQFDEVWPEMAELIGDRLVVAHNAPFDMSVLRSSARCMSYKFPPVQFACTYRIAQQTWLGRRSYKLADLADDLGIELDHHDALSDANAAAELMLAALNQHGVTSVDEVAQHLGFQLGEVLGERYHSFSNAWGDR